MDSNLFVCYCKEQIPFETNQLKTHISRCSYYQKSSPFFSTFHQLPTQRMHLTHLYALKAEFAYFLEQIELQIYQKMELELTLSSQIKYQVETTRCSGCLRQVDNAMILFLSCCFQPICRDCLEGAIQKEYIMNGFVSCPNKKCNKQVEQEDLQQFLGKQKFEEFQNYIVERMCDIITCIKCQQKYAFEVGSQVNGLKDPITQQPLTQRHIDHYRNNRFVCLNQGCKQEQCKQCRATPYHLGMDCQEYKIKQMSKRCRYCDRTITVVDTKKVQALQDICNDQECVEKSKYACQKMLSCGHSCCGFINEKNCPPCLNEKCCQKLEQKGEDYCNICFTEGLIQAPSIQTECGHIFHYLCVLKRLETRWNGPRIIFNFCTCPLCKKWLKFQKSKPQELIDHFSQLYQDVQKKALERLKYEGREKDEKVAKPGELYYGQQQEYSMAIYCYYQCFKCKKPYFGGAKDCQRGLEDDKKEFNPQELVCANCCEVPAGENCPKHGKEYIEFKCKFCCSLSVWFCWGTTHFCEECHKKQCAGDYVSKYPIEKLPKCPGPEKCPLKMIHKPNGEECALGCAICRNAKANMKEF